MAEPGTDSPWLRSLRPGPRPTSAAPPSSRLVCFPHAGGAATFFAPLARALPAAIDVVGLQYPGRQERLSEAAIDSIDGLVAAGVPELIPGLDRPFALLGHSMGAIVAYEVARILEHEQGLVPRALFVSGRRAPSTWRDEQVHRGGDPSLLREVARLGGTPPQLMDDEDVQQMMLPALRGDYRAIETYSWRPGPEPSCPVWAVVGDRDPLTTEDEAARWAGHTTGSFTLHVLPGAHFALTAHLPTIATTLLTALR